MDANGPNKAMVPVVSHTNDHSTGEATSRENGVDPAAKEGASRQRDKEKKIGPTCNNEEVTVASSPCSANEAVRTDLSRQYVVSKNQLKKRRRYEKAMEIKKRKKQQQKETRFAQAIANGRDLDEERRVQEERTKSGEGRQRREAFLQERMKTAEKSFQVCIDCSFSEHMSSKEIGSLSSQIRYSYAVNKKSKFPCFLSVANLSGLTYDNLTKVAGFPDLWRQRNFSCSERSILEMHADKSKLVYLTADSENIIHHLDNEKIYIIGGIVDRNRLKGATMAKSKELGIQTAKLPISEHLKLFASNVLTCNHVFEILLKYREHQNDWKKAMMDVLPKRKEASVVTPDGEDLGGSPKSASSL